MQTPLVFKLGAVALIGATLAPAPLAQDGTPRLRIPRPRAEITQAAPSMALMRRAERPKLGVRVEETAEGILVQEVLEGSLAAEMGVQAGDLLLSLDDSGLNGLGDIGEALGDVEPGSGFQLKLVREGEGLLSLDGQRPEPEPQPEPPAADGRKGGFLGVQMAGDDEQADVEGVKLAGVIDGSAAWYAGLEKGDVLTHVGDAAIASSKELVGAVGSRAPGELVELRWTRDGESLTTSVRLGRNQTTGFRYSTSPGQSTFMLPFDGSQGGSFTWPGSQGRRPFVIGRNGANRFFQLDDDGAWSTDAQDMLFDLEALHDLDGLFDELDIDVHGGEHGSFDLKDMLGDLDIDLDDLGDGAHSLRITIQDGQMTVDRDGDVEVYELDESHDHGDAHEHGDEDEDEVELQSFFFPGQRAHTPQRLVTRHNTPRVIVSRNHAPRTLFSRSAFPSGARVLRLAPGGTNTRYVLRGQGLAGDHCAPARVHYLAPQAPTAPTPPVAPVKVVPQRLKGHTIKGHDML